MELLYQRQQVTGRRPQFKLWAKVEPTEEEKDLINKYRMSGTVLVDVRQPGLLRTSIFVGFIAFLAVFLALALYFVPELRLRWSWMMINAVSALLGCGAGFLYYDRMRETIYVRDLLHGRYFTCVSVIELARKEAYLESITGYFRQVVESAKHWGGTEKMPIEPLPPEQAKEFILKGPLL